MKTRRLSQGMVEAYNDRLRIRLKPLPGADYALVIIYELKRNKFYRSRTEIKVDSKLTLDHIIQIYGVLEPALN